VAASFVVAWRKFDQATNPSLPWLFRIASYEVSNHRRSLRKWNNVVSIEVVGEYSTTSATSDINGTEISAALGRLSDVDQEILRLIHWDSLTRAEAAEVLRLTPNATNVRYHRALQRLQDQMPPKNPAMRTDDIYPILNPIPIKGAQP
jgi:RNA polymerase sigma factor (sigma-70 family)